MSKRSMDARQALMSDFSRGQTPSAQSGRTQLALRWVDDRLGDIRHEIRVAKIAAALVAATAKLHRIDSTDRRLLRLAAIVHDVGRCVDDRDHPRIGARMIREERELPLRRRERRLLSYLTRYHRGRVPEIGKDAMLDASDEHVGARTLLAFLRAADGLDSRCLGPVKLKISCHGRLLRIRCRVDADLSKARRAFARRKKFRLLEEVLGCRVKVNVIVNAQAVVGAV